MNALISAASALLAPFVIGWVWDGGRRRSIAKEYDVARYYRWDGSAGEWVADKRLVVTGR